MLRENQFQSSQTSAFLAGIQSGLSRTSGSFQTETSSESFTEQSFIETRAFLTFFTQRQTVFGLQFENSSEVTSEKKSFFSRSPRL